MEIGLGLQITLIGMGVVFATLVVLMAVVKIPQLFQNRQESSSSSATPLPLSPEVPPQHAAVIAAVVAMMGQAYRVKTIEIIGNDNWERSRYTEITSL